ncbi:MAG: hypothetical protein AAGA56_14220 [Myxococcota bacterium]
MHRHFAIVLLVFLIGGCRGEDPTATPEGVVRAFVERLQGFDGKKADGEALFELLSHGTRENLIRRADRYSAASGRTIPPWSILVPSRLHPRFVARAYVAEVVGRYALVDVLGMREDQRAQIPCILEEERWLVDLAVPELTPLPQRDYAPP